MIALLSELAELHSSACDQTLSEWRTALSGRPHLGGALLDSAGRHAAATALETARQSLSYRTVAHAAVNVATFLRQKLGRATGERVLIVLENSPEYLAAFYGTLLAGHVAVPLSVAIERFRLARIEAHCGAAMLLTAQRAAVRLGLLMEEGIERIDLNAQLVSAGAADVPAGAAPALILHTSGSIDEPKGVLLSHANLLANARSILEYLPIQSADRALALLPFCHAYGNSVLQTHVLRGATLVLDGSTAFPGSMVETLASRRITSFAAVPDLCAALFAISDLGCTPLPNLRYMTVAGGALRSGDAIRLSERIAPAELFLMYGQTEATARLAYLPPAELRRRPDSIGQAIPGVELEVRDASGQRTSGSGELWARGANIMLGYWNDAVGTARVLEDGWLRTGDLASIDNDGFISLQGRQSRELKLRGIRVDLEALTAALERRLPECRLAFVPFQQNQVMRLALFVECRDDSSVQSEAVQQVCRATLARHELPQYVEVVPSLPSTGSFKLDYRALRMRAEDRCESALCDVAS